MAPPGLTQIQPRIDESTLPKGLGMSTSPRKASVLWRHFELCLLKRALREVLAEDPRARPQIFDALIENAEWFPMRLGCSQTAAALQKGRTLTGSRVSGASTPEGLSRHDPLLPQLYIPHEQASSDEHCISLMTLALFACAAEDCNSTSAIHDSLQCRFPFGSLFAKSPCAWPFIIALLDVSSIPAFGQRCVCCADSRTHRDHCTERREVLGHGVPPSTACIQQVDIILQFFEVRLFSFCNPSFCRKGHGVSTSPTRHRLHRSILQCCPSCHRKSKLAGVHDSKFGSSVAFVIMTRGMRGRCLQESELANQVTLLHRCSCVSREFVTSFVASSVSVHQVARMPGSLAQSSQKKESTASSVG